MTSMVVRGNPLPLPRPRLAAPRGMPLPRRDGNAAVWLVGRAQGSPWQRGETASVHLGDSNHRIVAKNTQGMQIFDSDSIHITSPTIHLLGDVKIDGNLVLNGTVPRAEMAIVATKRAVVVAQPPGHLFSGGVLGGNRAALEGVRPLGCCGG